MRDGTESSAVCLSLYCFDRCQATASLRKGKKMIFFDLQAEADWRATARDRDGRFLAGWQTLDLFSPLPVFSVSLSRKLSLYIPISMSISIYLYLYIVCLAAILSASFILCLCSPASLFDWLVAVCSCPVVSL